MSELTKHDVLEKAKEADVKFVRLQFMDVIGASKNVAITVEQLEKALDGEIMFDGSSIQGFTRIQESDMYLKPDNDTFAVLPWRPQNASVARLICDVYTPDGRPFAGCPRNVLKKVLAEAAALGYGLQVGPEPEFFLFEMDDEGNCSRKTQDRGGYFDLSPIDKGEDARRDIVLALETMGFEVEASHHEVAPGQHEIDFRYTDALTTADNIATFRYVTKAVASQHGLHASFMPKPLFGENGSGMHIHQSLCKNGSNAFSDPDSDLGLSEVAMQYIGGIIEHAPALAAITNPTVNSYKRLVPGYEAPVYVCWSSKNRSALVRVPAATGEAARIELRNPDPSANPYLCLAAILKAGLDGINRQLDPGEQRFNNIYEMSEEERQEAGIASLPGSLKEALDVLDGDPLIQEALGSHVYQYYREAKLAEWDAYRIQVSDWEIDNYFHIT